MTLTEKGWSSAPKKTTGEIPTLSEALENTGFGKYSYFIIFTAGMNIFSSIFSTLLLSYVLPATDCDLNLTTGEKGFLSTMMFTGMLFTSHILGYMADERGRKYVVVRANFASGLLNLVSAFCPGFVSLSVVTFLNGASTAGVIIPSYVYVGENIRQSNRSVGILLTGAIGNLSVAVLPALAIFIIPLDFHWDVFGYLTFNSWRLVVLLASIPTIFGAVLFSMMDESPKYLLSKGYQSEALDVVKHIYSINTGRPANEFPFQNSIRLDQDEIDASSDTDQGLKRVWTKTVTLFKKPLLKFSIMSCIIQTGLVGTCNIIFLWLPQLVKQMMNYAADHPMYGVTLCEVAQLKMPLKVSLNSTIATEDQQYDLAEYPCVIDIPVDTYYVSFTMGVAQFVVFMISGAIARKIGSKILLVSYTFLVAGLIFGMTLVTDMWITIVCMVGSGVLLAASLPMCIGILIEFFPTSVRSTASCICMVCGRLASTVGAQIIGLMQKNYCNISYWGLGVIVIGIGVILLLAPTKRKG